MTDNFVEFWKIMIQFRVKLSLMLREVQDHAKDRNYNEAIALIETIKDHIIAKLNRIQDQIRRLNG